MPSCKDTTFIILTKGKKKVKRIHFRGQTSALIWPPLPTFTHLICFCVGESRQIKNIFAYCSFLICMMQTWNRTKFANSCEIRLACFCKAVIETNRILASTLPLVNTCNKAIVICHTWSSGTAGPFSAHAAAYLGRGWGRTSGYGLRRLLMSHFAAWLSSLDMVTCSRTRKLLLGVKMVRVCVRKGGRWNIRVTDMAPMVTRSKLKQREREDIWNMKGEQTRPTFDKHSLRFFPPSIFSTDAVAILWMLWKSDVDTN